MKVMFFNFRVEKFSDSFDERTQKYISEAIEMLEIYGHTLCMPYSKPIGSHLFELRITETVQIRFVYTFYNRMAWILHGFVKKTKRISNRDVVYARKQYVLLLRNITKTL